jgi:hypothetical protein
MHEIKILHGIDSLYYFCESNENYDDLYLEILDQVEERKGIFEKKDIEFENNDIHILINDIPLNFLGIAEGFHWFKDINEFFKIGFKDKYKNRGLNDIRVQLQGVGIYTIGIKSLIDFINNSLLENFVTGYYPITRADLNCFVQYDFSFVTKEMFVTRKRKYSTISEIGNANTVQTLYVGKEPFKLRLYNKKEELKKSKKKDLMYEYFANNGFDLEKEIFNVEFELHRTHLKTFNISTIEELLSNAVNLFKQSMDDIRLVDISNITENDIKNNSKSRAETLAIWEHIKNSYKLDDFLQIQLPLSKVKRAISIYDDNKFELEYIALLRKAFINNLNMDKDYTNTLFDKAKESLRKTTTTKELKKSYIDVEIISIDGKKENFRLLENKKLIKPLRTETVANLSDYDLLVYLDKTRKKKHLTPRDNHIYTVAHKEASRRNLILDISSSDEIDF